MKDVRVTVVIPTFNRGHLVSETIESILNQTHKAAEIIVVDDGSTDDTEEIVGKFKDKVRYYRIENSGVCKARNIGVEKSQSAWIAFCDSDDLWYPDKLHYQVELIRAVPSVEYCFTNFQNFRNGEYSRNTKFDDAPMNYWDIARLKATKNAFVATEPLYPKVLTFQPIFPSTIMMKRTFFDRIGQFDESFGRTMSEDLEFTLRCVQEAPIGVVTKPLVGVRWHERNFSSGKLPGISFILGDIEILEYSSKRHRLGPQYRALIQEQIINRSISVMHGAFLLGDFKLVRNIVKNIPVTCRSPKIWIKTAIAYLPYPIAKTSQQWLTVV